MKERRTRSHFIAWWTEVVVQRTGKWRQCGKEPLVVYEVGEASAMIRSLRELEWREEKGGGKGICLMGRRASGRVPKRGK